MVTLYNTVNDYNSSLVDVSSSFTFANQGYRGSNEFPLAETLTSYRDDAYDLIKSESRGQPASRKYLRNQEYRMVEMMIDEEEARADARERPQFMPRDYMFERDRKKIGSMGPTGFTRGTGH